jgi:hypothetical protein
MAKRKVFISWAGERSKVVAAALNEWLPQIVPAADPFFSPDIEKGTKSFEAIQQALQEDCGIFCLTRENLENRWLHFEAGAIFNGRDKSRVWTLLLCGLGAAEVKKPLDFPQHTFPTDEDCFKLISSINSACGEDAISEKYLRRNFEAFWQYIGKAITEADAMVPDAVPAKRTADDKLDELVLGLREIRAELTGLTYQIPATARDDIRDIIKALEETRSDIVNNIIPTDDDVVAILTPILARMSAITEKYPSVVKLPEWLVARAEATKVLFASTSDARAKKNANAPEENKSLT